MKTIVLRKLTKPAAVAPYLEPVASPTKSQASSFKIEIVNASRTEVASDDDVIATGDGEMPIQLIKPLANIAAGVGQPPQVSWGVTAVGAEKLDHHNGEQAVVAVLDTGIDFQHPAFNGMCFDDRDLCDFTGGDNNSPRQAVADDQGHGTHCAGTIFGRAVNGTHIGIAPGVKRAIIGRIIGPNGGTAEQVVNAVHWAHARGAQVISLSVGQNFTAYFDRLCEKYNSKHRALAEVIESYVANVKLFDVLSALISRHEGLNRSSLLFAAAGNDSNRINAFIANLASPASGEDFVAVAALAPPKDTNKYAIANFSNAGAKFAAPGINIWSAKKGGGLEPLDGTSMATPHAAGVAALWIDWLSKKGYPFDAAAVLDEMKKAAISLPNLRRKDVGAGLVQAPQE